MNGAHGKRKSVILSSVLPSLSVILSIVLTVACGMYGRFATLFTIALGAVCGGAVPLFLIIVWKTDISVYWIGKAVLLGAFWVGFAFMWFAIPDWMFSYFGRPFVLPFLILIAEILFAATRRTNFKTRLCLVLSAPIWLYAGFMIDFIRALMNDWI